MKHIRGADGVPRASMEHVETADGARQSVSGGSREADGASQPSMEHMNTVDGARQSASGGSEETGRVPRSPLDDSNVDGEAWRWRKEPAERQAEARPDDLHHERRARRGPRDDGGDRTVRPIHGEGEVDDRGKADKQPHREKDPRRFGIMCHGRSSVLSA